VPEPALTPALALDYLDELSTDIRGAVLLDAEGAVAAGWRGDTERAARLRAPLAELLRRADEAAGDAGPATQVEVTTSRGAVFCVRDEHWTLAAVTGRFALPSLVFYDLRHALRDLRADAS
jgi:predicted regulator of Ras-like GTPase activity (Roadblock/LC7/MglB family)